MATKNTKLVEGIGFTSGGVFGEQLGAQVEIASGPKGDTGDQGPPGASVDEVIGSKTGETVSLTFSLDNDTDLETVNFNVADGVSIGTVTESQADNVVTLNFTLADGTPLEPVTFNTPAGTLLEEVPTITLNDVGDGSYTLTFTYSSGTPMTTGSFTPPRGMDSEVPGPRGFYVTDAAVAPISGTTDTFGLTLTTNNPDEPTIDAGTFTVTEVANFPLAGLTDVTLTSPGYGQAVVRTGADGAADEWTNQDVSHITLHSTVQGGDQQQLRSLVETVYASDGTTSEIVWVFESIAPVTPGDPVASFSPDRTQYGFNTGDTIVLTLTADTSTNSFFSVSDGGQATQITNISRGGIEDTNWTAAITSTQPADDSDDSVTTLTVTLTATAAATQIAGDFTVNMEVVVDNPTTHPANVLSRGYTFTIAEATDATMSAAYTATTYMFDGNDHDAQTGTATLTVSNGEFVGAPTISASAATLTLGTVTVNAANTVATVPYTVAEPPAQTTVTSMLTWDATAQTTGATGTNGQTTEVAGSPQVITIIGEPASNPSATGNPPANTSDSAFDIPSLLQFEISSSSELGNGHYSYVLADSDGTYSPAGAVAITGTTATSTNIELAGTTAFPSPAASGYAQRGIQIGWSDTDAGTYTVVTNLEDTDLETYHPILLWYDQTVTSAADITALYPAVDMEATEVIIPSSDDIITGHVFTPTEGNFLMILIPDTWNAVTAVSVVGDGNDQPAGVTTLPSGQITAINDSFGTPVLYQGFYVTGVTPNVRLRIDSITTS